MLALLILPSKLQTFYVAWRLLEAPEGRQAAVSWGGGMGEETYLYYDDFRLN
jgi:hypothetical protein